MAENERDEGGISVGDIFRTIFSQKWLALILVVVITVLSTVWFYVLNRQKGNFVISFSINMPNSNNTDSYYKYPDGSRFYYTDYVSSDVINNVKAGDPSFADTVDVAKVMGSIDLEEKIDAIESTIIDGQEVTIINRRTFDLKINSQAFKNFETASNFMRALATYPVNLFSKMDIDYNVYLNKYDFDKALSYDMQINYLSNQINYLNSYFAALSGISSSKSIESKREEFNSWVARIDLGSLLTEAGAKYYLKDWETSIAKNENQRVSVEKSLADAIRNRDNVQQYLTDNNIQSDDVASVVKDLEAQVISLERQLKTYDDYKNAYYSDYENRVENTAHIAATKEFAKKIQDIYDKMTEENGYIEQFAELNKQIYGNEATVSFVTPNFITNDAENMGLLMSIIISLVIGIVVAMIVSYIVGYIVNKKRANAKQTAAALPMQEQAEVAQEQTENAQPEQSQE